MLTRLRVAAALLAIGLGVPARADEHVLPERLYVPQGTLTGSPRIVALGGAYVSIAEGAEAISSNVAAMAHRPPTLKGSWQFDGTFSWLDLPIGNPERRDLDNDGIADRGRSSSQYLGAAMLHIKRVGVGAYYRSSLRTFCSEALPLCPAGDYLTQWMGDMAFATAMSFLYDDLIIGGAVHLNQATFGFNREDWYYQGWGWEVDALYRPNGLPVRLGVAYRSQVVANYQPKPNQLSVVAPETRGERRIHAAVVNPSVLSFGASFRLGEGSGHYNRLSPKTREDMLEHLGESRTPPDVPLDTPMGRWLISMQADLIFPVENAVSTVAFTSPDSNPEKPPRENIGHNFLVVPRLGVENDTVMGRLRLRVGGYFEPSPFEGRPQRTHLTGGFSLRLFRFLMDWSAFTAVDYGFNAQNLGPENLSPNYQYISFGVSVWDGPKDPEQVRRERAKKEEERRQEERDRREEEEEERREREEEERERREEERQEPAPPEAPPEGGKVIEM